MQAELVELRAQLGPAQLQKMKDEEAAARWAQLEREEQARIEELARRRTVEEEAAQRLKEEEAARLARAAAWEEAKRKQEQVWNTGCWH